MPTRKGPAGWLPWFSTMSATTTVWPAWTVTGVCESPLSTRSGPFVPTGGSLRLPPHAPSTKAMASVAAARAGATKLEAPQPIAVDRLGIPAFRASARIQLHRGGRGWLLEAMGPVRPCSRVRSGTEPSNAAAAFGAGGLFVAVGKRPRTASLPKTSTHLTCQRRGVAKLGRGGVARVSIAGGFFNNPPPLAAEERREPIRSPAPGLGHQQE